MLLNSVFIFSLQTVRMHLFKDNLGKYKIGTLHRTDINRFYNHLVDIDGLKIGTIWNIHLIIYQILQLAVEDDILRKNVSDNGLRDLKKVRGLYSKKHKALTITQQNLFLDFIKKSPKYKHWYSTFAIMLETGLGVSKLTGLRWQDIDFTHNVININHTLFLCFMRDLKLKEQVLGSIHLRLKLV